MLALRVLRMDLWPCWELRIGRTIDSMETILVGIDHSSNACDALRWALDHAAPDDQIIAIHVWHMPPIGGLEAVYLDPAPFEEGARLSAQDVVNDVLKDREVDAERVTLRVLAGHTSGTLIEEAQSADLLVLGSRGHGGFAGLLLGSVTRSVANHAPCPVVVIPPVSPD